MGLYGDGKKAWLMTFDTSILTLGMQYNTQRDWGKVGLISGRHPAYLKGIAQRSRHLDCLYGDGGHGRPLTAFCLCHH